MSAGQEFFLSRQPIVGPDRRFVGWEMVLGDTAGTDLSRDPSAHEGYDRAFSFLSKMDSWDTLLCGGRAVLRADRTQIFSEAIGSFPRNRILLALPESFEADAQVSSRLHTLHRHGGMRLLFDQYKHRDSREELLELADMVHVDTQETDEASQNRLVRRAKRRSLAVMARNVDRDQDFRRLKEGGFDLFQGLHYADEDAGEEGAANLDGQVLLNIMLDARAGLDLSETAKKIEAHVQLREGLLRLVNSLELARAQKIESVLQALIMIGADGLSRWLNLLLFRYGAAGGERGPLFRVAASRARLMELLATDGAFEDPQLKEDGESAFLVGMLSFVHVLLGTSSAKAASDLDLPPNIQLALLEHAGPLGRLLALASHLDAGRFPEVAECVAELGVEPVRLWRHQRDAYGWVYSMA